MSLPDIFVRCMDISDLEASYQLEEIVYRQVPGGVAWTREEVQRLLENPNCRKIAVALEAEPRHIIAQAFFYDLALWIAQDRDMESFEVHPDWRRHGIGSALLQCIIDDAKKSGVASLSMDINPLNTDGQEFLIKQKFRETATNSERFRTDDGQKIESKLFVHMVQEPSDDPVIVDMRTSMQSNVNKALSAARIAS